MYEAPKTIVDILIDLVELAPWEIDDTVKEQFYDYTPHDVIEFENGKAEAFCSYIHFVTAEEIIENSAHIVRSFQEFAGELIGDDLILTPNSIALAFDGDVGLIFITPNKEGFFNLYRKDEETFDIRPYHDWS